MVGEELFQPSLNQDDTNSTDSYNISNFVYIAFFGGVIPLIALGTKNAKWLRIEKKIINSLIAVGCLIFIGKLMVYAMMVNNSLVLDYKYFKWGYKVASLLLYMVYYGVMKGKYKLHILNGGETKLLTKDGLKWIVIASLVEALLLILVGGIVI